MGLDENRKGILLIVNGFYLHVTEDPIYETNLVAVESMPAAHGAVFLKL